MVSCDPLSNRRTGVQQNHMCSKNCRRYFMRISSPEKETLTRKSPPSAEHTTFSGVDGACSQYQRKLANANYVNTSRTNGVNESAEPESDEEDVVGFVRVRLQVLRTQPKADALTGEMGQARGRARTRAKDEAKRRQQQAMLLDNTGPSGLYLIRGKSAYPHGLHERRRRLYGQLSMTAISKH